MVGNRKRNSGSRACLEQQSSSCYAVIATVVHNHREREQCSTTGKFIDPVEQIEPRPYVYFLELEELQLGATELELLQLGATELELLEQQLRISEQLPDQVTSGFQYLIDGLALPVFTISSVFMLTLWGLVTTVATGSGGLATTKISEGILMLWDCTIFDTLIVTTGGNY
ncbi:hypothetical protein F0562_007516 [Nyssa sinensis]|uniref:Uncharacterized protein n=1 Tax=Nyssa sinensis TaxID=561372 RepID=A0A5J5A5X4_9ASTE|nr:hypothetical protein F0562_007516 [Nyssa sinensis]